MLSTIFNNEEVSMLHALRSKTTNCKANFKFKYRNEDLLCNLCHTANQDQQHLLTCEVLQRQFKTKQQANNKVDHENIFSEDVQKQ